MCVCVCVCVHVFKRPVLHVTPLSMSDIVSVCACVCEWGGWDKRDRPLISVLHTEPVGSALH